MALLAILDIEDVATEKIRGARNALDELVQSVQRASQTVGKGPLLPVDERSAQVVRDYAQAAGEIAAQSVAARAEAAQATQAYTEQAAAMATVMGNAQAAAQAVLALTNAVTAAGVAAETMQGVATSAKLAADELAQFTANVQEFGRQAAVQQRVYEQLVDTLREGAVVTESQARAFDEYVTKIIFSKGYSEELKDTAVQLGAEMREGTVITQQMAAELQKVGEAAGFLKPKLEEVDNAQQRADVSAAALAATLAALTVGLYAALRGATELAGKVELMQLGMSELAENIGQSGYAAREQADGINELGYSMTESADAVLKLSRSQVDLAKATDLASAARDMSIAAGQGEAEMLQQLIRFVETGQARVLKQIGIMATSEQIYLRHAQAIGTTVDKLTEFDKRQANVNFILGEAAKFTGLYEKSLTTAQGRLNALNSDLEDAEARLGEGLLPIYTALIDATVRLVDAWNTLDPSVRAVVASAGAAVLVFTTLLGVLAAGKWVAAFTGLTAAASAFFGVISTGGGVMAALAAVGLGPVSLAIIGISAALAAGVGAWNLYQNSLPTPSELQGQVDAAVKERDALAELTEQAYKVAYEYDKLRAQKKLNVAVDTEYRDIAEKLLRISPELVKVINAETREYEIQLDALRDLNAEKQHGVDLSLKGLQASADQASGAVAGIKRQQAELNQLIADIQSGARARYERTGSGGIGGGSVSIDLLERARKGLVSLDQQLAETEKQAKITGEAFTRAWESAQKSEVQQRLAFVDARKELSLYIDKLGGVAEFNKRVAATKFDYSKISEAPDPTKVKAALAALDEAWERYLKKREADAKKAQQIEEGFRKQLEKNTMEMGIQRRVLNEYLQAASDSGNMAQWNKLLEEQGSTILKLGTSAEYAAQGYNALAKARDELVARSDPAFWAEQEQQFTSFARSINEAVRDMAAERGGQTEQLAREVVQQRIEIERTAADEIFEMDRELYERRMVSKMEAVDQEIYQEGRRLKDIERAFERERQMRDEAIAQERMALDERLQLQREEIDSLIRKAEIQRQINRAEIEAQRELATNDDERTKLTRKLEIYDLTTDRIKEYMGFVRDMAQTEIELDAARNRAIINGREETNAKLTADQRAALDRQKADFARTAAEIVRSASVAVQGVRALTVGWVESISDGFMKILSGTEKTSDALVGIVESMRDKVLSIIEDMITQWIQKAARLASSDGGFDVGTFFRGLMGRGGATGGGGLSMGGPQGALGSRPISGTGSFAGQGFGGGVPMAGGGFGGTWRSGSGFAQTGMGGFMAGAGTGALVGGMVGSKFADGSPARGFWTGAASGAATGAAVGGWWGAAGGFIGGGISGWMAGRRQREEMKKDREAIIESAGGLEELKRKAKEAGFAIDKFLDTKKVSEYQRELKKMIDAFTQLDRKKLIDAEGGMENLVAKAREAGIEISEMFQQGRLRGEALAEEIEKINKAFELKKAKDGLARTFTQMSDLRRAAQLAGYDIQRAFDAKTIEEFNAEQERLNELLAKQAERIAAIQNQAVALGVRLEGLGGFVERSFDDLFGQLGKEGRQALEDAFKSAQESGYSDTIFKFARENAERFGLDLDRLAERTARFQESFNRISSYAVSTFASMLRETGDIGAAMNAVLPTLDEMSEMMAQLGLEAPEALRHLMEFRNTIRNNEDVATSLSAINQMLRSMADSGSLTVTMFNTLGADAADQWRIMEERGVAADQALLLMQPTLQALYEAQKNFGFATDEATQRLIDMGKEHGLVGDQFQSINQKMLDMLVIIAEVLGADIPEAYRNQTAAANEAANAASNAARDQQKAVKEHETAADAAAEANRVNRDRLHDVGEEVRNLDGIQERADLARPYIETRGSIQEMVGEFDPAKTAVTDFADHAVSELARVEEAVNAVSFGRSPGGLKEIPIQSAEAALALSVFSRSSTRKMRDLEDAVRHVGNRMGDVAGNFDPGAAVVPDPGPAGSVQGSANAAPVESGPISITIEPKIEVYTPDKTGTEQFLRENAGPWLVKAVSDNQDQIAVRLQGAIDRYRQR